MIAVRSLLKVLLKYSRLVGTIVCMATFLLWSKKATEKLISKPIGSSISYKDGDDGNGMIKFPIVTFCPQSLRYFTLSPDFDEFCSCGTSFFQVLLGCTKDYQWAKVYKDCYGQSNGFTTIDNSTQKLQIKIYPFLRSVSFGKYHLPKSLLDFFGLPLDTKKLEQELLQSVHQSFHQRFGTCYSFDIGEQMDSLVEPQKLSFTFTTQSEILIALHEKPEDRFEALEVTGHNFNIKSGLIYWVRFKKIQIESLSQDDHPCSKTENYSTQQCELEHVSILPYFLGQI